MSQIFGLDIRQLLYAAMRGRLIKGTLVKVTEGARNPADPTSGTVNIETGYDMEGFIDVKDVQLENTTIRQGRVVFILGGSLDVEPEPGDRIIMENINFTVTRIFRDPVGAGFECLVDD